MPKDTVMVRTDLKLDRIQSPLAKQSPLQVCLEELSRVSYSLEWLGGLVFIRLSLEDSFLIWTDFASALYYTVMRQLPATLPFNSPFC